MRVKGWVYHTHWMSRHGIPPLPMWLVCWFVIPLEAWRRRKRDGNRPQD